MINTITFVFCLFLSCSYSQNNTLVSGGIAIGNTGSASYSVGQIDYTSQQNASTGFVSLGIQQPYEVIVLGTQHNDILFAVSVYPNPLADRATLTVKDYEKWGDLTCQLIDINGRIIQNAQKITQTNTVLNLATLPSGVYFLKLNNNQQKIKTFKIIKK